MAKFEEVFPDTQQKFTTFIGTIDSLRDVRIKILTNNRLKEIGKVVKANDLLKHLTDEDVIILLNEQIFEQLEEEQQKMLVEELVAEIYYDLEKEKVSLLKPDFNTFSLFLQKFGYQKIDALHESIRSLFGKANEEDAENNN